MSREILPAAVCSAEQLGIVFLAVKQKFNDNGAVSQLSSDYCFNQRKLITYANERNQTCQNEDVQVKTKEFGINATNVSAFI